MLAWVREEPWLTRSSHSSPRVEARVLRLPAPLHYTAVSEPLPRPGPDAGPREPDHLSCTSPRQGARAGARSALYSPRDPRAWRRARRVARLGRRARAPPDPAAHDDTSASQSESPRPLPAHLPPPPPGSRSSRSQQSPARVQGPRRRQEAGRARAPPRPPSGRRGWGRGRPGWGGRRTPPRPTPEPASPARSSSSAGLPCTPACPRAAPALGTSLPALRHRAYSARPGRARPSASTSSPSHPIRPHTPLQLRFVLTLPQIGMSSHLPSAVPGTLHLRAPAVPNSPSPRSLACLAPPTSFLSLPHGPLAQFSPYPYRQTFSPYLVRNFKV